MGATAPGGHYFDLTPPKVIDQDSQANYKRVVDENRELFKTLSEVVFRYCESGSCEDLALLVRGISYIVQSGQQVIIDSEVCLQCQERDCSARGNGEGLTD